MLLFLLRPLRNSSGILLGSRARLDRLVARFQVFRSKYNKTIIRFGFSDIQNNQGLGKGYQPQPLASADNPLPRP